jgi:hypothetical protein
VESKKFTDGIKELHIFLTDINTNLHLLITYQLEQDVFYIRRKLTLSDSLSGLHFVHQLWPLYCRLQDKIAIIKKEALDSQSRLKPEKEVCFSVLNILRHKIMLYLNLTVN